MDYKDPIIAKLAKSRELGELLLDLSSRMCHIGASLQEGDPSVQDELQRIIDAAQSVNGAISELTGCPLTPEAARELEAHLG